VQSKWYEIRIQGTLSPDWSEWFEGMEIRHEGEGQTILAGRVVDQAALHGLLARVRDLNLTLLSVNPAFPSELPAAHCETKGE
jgi:hypothetical protein